jgi:integrase
LSKKSRRKPKAGRVVRRTLADGSVREYRYGAYKAPLSRVQADSLEALIRAYKRSPSWTALAKATKASRLVYLKELEEIGHLPIRKLVRRDILAIRDAIASTRGNGAATGFVRVASVLFDWAVDQDWIPHTPVHKVKRLPIGELPAWSAEQAMIALQGAPERLRRVIVLGLYTGQRRGDLCTVRWSDYDGATIKFVQQKTGAKVVLQVHPDLKAELDGWERAGDTILLNARGGPWAPNTLSKLMPETLRRLGLPPGLNVHGMRKLFAAGMAGNGATVHEIGANTGHKTLSMIQLYTLSADQRKLSERSVGKIQTFTNKLQPVEKK